MFTMQCYTKLKEPNAATKEYCNEVPQITAAYIFNNNIVNREIVVLEVLSKVTNQFAIEKHQNNISVKFSSLLIRACIQQTSRSSFS